MSNIKYSISPHSGFLGVEDVTKPNTLVEFTEEDIIDLIKALHSNVKTNFNSRQFNVGVGGFVIDDKIQNTRLTLTLDNVVELGNFVRKNKGKITSRKDL